MLLTDGYPCILIIGNNGSNPAGLPTVNSFSSFVNAALQALLGTLTPYPPLLYRCREVQPPDLDQGGPIDVTSMNNANVRTRVHKHLTSIGVVTAHVEWDTVDYGVALPPTPALGVNVKMGILFPDLSTLTFWGWLDKFTPTSFKEGELPTAEMKIEVSCLNSSGVETIPVWGAGPVGNGLGIILP